MDTQFYILTEETQLQFGNTERSNYMNGHQLQPHKIGGAYKKNIK